MTSKLLIEIFESLIEVNKRSGNADRQEVYEYSLELVERFLKEQGSKKSEVK